TDTTQTDFQRGIPTKVDLTTSPGDVILLNAANLDQQNTNVSTSGFGFTNTAWAGQTFTPAVTGQLTRVDLDLSCAVCSGANPNIALAVGATNASLLPTGADLATATIPGFSGVFGGFFSANFASPPTLTAGTRYAIIFRLVSPRTTGTGTQVYAVSTASTYASGHRVTSANSGRTWTADTSRDLGFKTYMKTGFPSAGNLVSGLVDANPHVGGSVNWTTLSWNAALPAGTTLKFQAAASNSANGPFN